MNLKIKPILEKLRAGLTQLYGERLVRLILFGSQARGDAQETSDIDVLLVFKSPFNRSVEKKQVIHLTALLSLENDTVISCLYMPEERFLHEDSPLLRNIRQEGVAL